MSALVLTGDCLEWLRKIRPDSIDVVATDPPYGLAFMGKDWDKALPDPRVWSEALRVAKPGAHLVCFGAPRCYHRVACHIEDAGWNIRDCLMWLYGSGFPKGGNIAISIDKSIGGMGHRGKRVKHHVGQESLERPGSVEPHKPMTPEAKQWEGWGTCLKPAWEPILLARKPFPGSVTSNVLEHGTGAINIDGCRIGTEGGGTKCTHRDENGKCLGHKNAGQSTSGETFHGPDTAGGRWPANLVLDEEAGALLDAQSGITKSTGGLTPGAAPNGIYGTYGKKLGANAGGLGDTGGASRFFYCAKASRSEREAGLEAREAQIVNDGRETSMDTPYQRGDTKRLNTHPTVKPLDLMRWLVRLVTPPGGVVLDPFTGSGTTGCAAVLEGFDFLGFELDPDHAELARTRIAHWQPKEGITTPMLPTEPNQCQGEPRCYFDRLPDSDYCERHLEGSDEMKLKAAAKREAGTCYVSRCSKPTAAIVDGKTFFSQQAGEIELCEAHTMKAADMAEQQGKELVWRHPEEGSDIARAGTEPAPGSTSIVVASDDIRNELASETTQANEALAAFRDFAIDTKDDLTFAADMLAEAKGHIKRLDARRKSITKPLNDALKATRALFKPALDFYGQCETTLKSKMAEAHQRAREEQRAALAEAQAATTEGDTEAQRDALAAMDDAAAFPDVAGVQYRTVWRFEITDEDAVPRDYCSPDLKLISGVVTHRKGSTEIAGVRVFEDTVIASKST